MAVEAAYVHTQQIIAVVIAVVVAYASTQPDRFQVKRSTSIKASADKILPLEKIAAFLLDLSVDQRMKA